MSDSAGDSVGKLRSGNGKKVYKMASSGSNGLSLGGQSSSGIGGLNAVVEGSRAPEATAAVGKSGQAPSGAAEAGGQSSSAMDLNGEDAARVDSNGDVSFTKHLDHAALMKLIRAHAGCMVILLKHSMERQLLEVRDAAHFNTAMGRRMQHAAMTFSACGRPELTWGPLAEAARQVLALQPRRGNIAVPGSSAALKAISVKNSTLTATAISKWVSPNLRKLLDQHVLAAAEETAAAAAAAAASLAALGDRERGWSVEAPEPVEFKDYTHDDLIKRLRDAGLAIMASEQNVLGNRAQLIARILKEEAKQVAAQAEYEDLMANTITVDKCERRVGSCACLTARAHTCSDL